MSTIVNPSTEARIKQIRGRIQTLKEWLLDNEASLDWGKKWYEKDQLERELKQLEGQINNHSKL